MARKVRVVAFRQGDASAPGRPPTHGVWVDGLDEREVVTVASGAPDKSEALRRAAKRLRAAADEADRLSNETGVR
jgi:hypothetical protein